jgi:hypothetical protein
LKWAKYDCIYVATRHSKPLIFFWIARVLKVRASRTDSSLVKRERKSFWSLSIDLLWVRNATIVVQLSGNLNEDSFSPQALLKKRHSLSTSFGIKYVSLEPHNEAIMA